jgi:hypothetical protein
MSLFKNLKPIGGASDEKSAQDTYPLVARQAWCSVCDASVTFTRIWRRAAKMRSCPTCKDVFENPDQLYIRFQPACPKCAEPLEQPGFDYGFCDRCGSKFELMEGAKPGLLPNQQQREVMNKHGKSRSSI